MEAALILARFWGIILVVLSGSVLINAKFYVRLVKGLQDGSECDSYIFSLVLVIGAVNVFVFL